MQSAWRVACVRIPRFPIGAVWRDVLARLPEGSGGAGEAETQLSLALTPPPSPTPPAPRPPASDGAPSPRSRATPSSPPRGEGGTPHWDDHPIALADGAQLRAVTAAAGRAHVRAGMSVPEARARCAELVVHAWDEVAIADAVLRATAALVAASPQVTPVAGAPGTWWVGAGGVGEPGGDGERALARTLLAIARRWSPHARVAIADSCVAARAATWRTPVPSSVPAPLPDDAAATAIVPPGGCAAFLAPAPLGLIPMDEELRETLVALGLRTVGALAALEAEDVERRWGASGLAAWHLARGDDPRRPGLLRVEAPRQVALELGASAHTTEPVLFLVRAALERLVAGLVADARAAASVAITLVLDDRRGALPDAPAHTVTREARPARPLARVTPLFERCRALLEQWVLPAPVCGVTVSIPATAPLTGEQGDLLAHGWHDPAAADAALARLRAELGTGAVVRPVARDTHRPEQAGAWVEADESSGATSSGSGPADGGRPPVADGTLPGAAGGPADDDPHSPLRLLETPEPVDVECDSAPDGPPRTVRWRSRRLRIAHARGPERLTGDWWTDRYARDYWRCEEADGDAELLLYRERGRWYLQGWYD